VVPNFAAASTFAQIASEASKGMFSLYFAFFDHLCDLLHNVSSSLLGLGVKMAFVVANKAVSVASVVTAVRK
jgi:hypothetical protein